MNGAPNATAETIRSPVKEGMAHGRAGAPGVTRTPYEPVNRAPPRVMRGRARGRKRCPLFTSQRSSNVKFFRISGAALVAVLALAGSASAHPTKPAGAVFAQN